MKTIINILLLFFFITSESQANENLNNKILKNLRCLVCQGQTVQDSNSEFALIIKSVVKDKIKEYKPVIKQDATTMKKSFEKEVLPGLKNMANQFKMK